MTMKYRNGVFLVTDEMYCPLYNVGEEFAVQDGILHLPIAKPTCLNLASEIHAITTQDESYEKTESGEKKKVRFDCGGCTGIIRFEFKKEKGFQTIQMKLLAATDRKEKIRTTAVFADLLRKVDIFSSLTNDELLDLAALMELREYPWGFPILQKGDPGSYLYIIIEGKVEVIDEEGVVFGELGVEDVFGEMSLLSGEPVTSTILAAEPCKIAATSQKNFRHLIQRFPTLQVFFYKLLVSRIIRMNQQRADELASGMTGQLADISPVELCQMINSNQKTGVLRLDADEQDRAILMFNEGELIHAEMNNQQGKEAFYRILRLKSGRFKFTQGLTTAQQAKNIIGGFMALVLEGMKQMDDGVS